MLHGLQPVYVFRENADCSANVFFHKFLIPFEEIRQADDLHNALNLRHRGKRQGDEKKSSEQCAARAERPIGLIHIVRKTCSRNFLTGKLKV